MNHKTWYWWLLITLASFGLLESIALSQESPRPTLSYVIRRHVRRHRFFSGLFTAFLVWFLWHIVWESDE